MFFTVIVPTYNPTKDLPMLLTSISRNECINDIEIILSDDCSDEPFDDVISSFSMLNIRVIRNEKHAGFPRDGRQNGANAAEGEWICFADQDDYFVDNAFDKAKQYIEEKEIHNYLATTIIMHAEGSEEYSMFDPTKGWTHGKFYEKSFWDQYNLGYDDVSYCEDINLSTKTGCVMVVENIPMNIWETPLYIWNKKTDSLSEGDYLLKSMPDYIRGTIGVIVDYIEKYKFNNDVMEKLTIKFIQTLYHLYFYFQSDRLTKDRMIVLQSAIYFYPYYEKFKECTGFTTEILLDRTEGELIEFFAETRNDDMKQLPFIEKMTFKDWVKAYLN